MTKQTNTGDRIKELRLEAARHQRAINAARRLARTGISAGYIIDEEQSQRDQALNEAQELRDSGLARLEDLRVYKAQKMQETKKGTKTHEYYYASWRRGEKVVNQYLGSTKKIDYDSAMMMARRLKAENLGIHLEEDSGTF